MRTEILIFAIGAATWAQGMAPGNGVAQASRPLPKGMKPPAVDYRNVAAIGGLTGVNVSGAERGKQYIVEATGAGTAMFDFDNDGWQDLLFVNGSRLDGFGSPRHFLYRNQGGAHFRGRDGQNRSEAHRLGARGLRRRF